MRTAGPTARSALAFFEHVMRPLHMLSPRLGLFYGDGPADPFIPRKRRDIFPCGKRGLVGGKGIPQIRREFVYDAAGNCFFRHTFILFGFQQKGSAGYVTDGDWIELTKAWS